MNPTLLDVIRALYASEINCRIWTFWDGGLTVEIGDELNGFRASEMFDEDSFAHAAQWLDSKARELYPKSKYASQRERLTDEMLVDLIDRHERSSVNIGMAGQRDELAALRELRDLRQYARKIYDYMATRRLDTWDEFELRGLVEYAVGMPIPQPHIKPEART